MFLLIKERDVGNTLCNSRFKLPGEKYLKKINFNFTCIILQLANSQGKKKY